jgi:beta-glucosidase
MFEGRYTDAYLEQVGGDAPTFTDDDLKTIASPLDFAGINVYRPHVYVQPSDERLGYSVVPFNASHPKMHSDWHVLAPEVMYWAPRQVQSLWGAGRSSSPRTAVPPWTSLPTTGRCTTRTG